MDRAKQRSKPKIDVPDFWTSQSHSRIRTQYGEVPFIPFEWQKQWIGQKRDDFENLTWDNLTEFYSVTPREMLLKSRDVGSSEICVRWFCWLQLRFGGNILIKADVHDNAQNLIRLARQYLSSLPAGEKPNLTTDNETELELEGIGSILAVARGRGRSERCRYMLKTERAFWENSVEEEAAILGTLVAGGWMIQESTALGFNEYHADWEDANVGYRKTFIGRDDNPTHDAAWWERVQKEVAKLGKTLGQEYPATPEEAFVTSSNTVFDAEVVQDYFKASQSPKRTYQNGAVSIWVEPVVARQYVAGADVAEGIDIGNGRLDYSHMAIYDWRTQRHVAALHGQWPTDVYAQLLYELGKVYGFPFLGVERNNSGLSVLTTLQALSYPADKLFWHGDPETGTKMGNPAKSVLGWRTTPKTKKEMEMDFGAAIKAGEIVSYDRRLWDQCLSYVYRGDRGTGGQQNCHDDIVLAHMIALQMRNHLPMSRGLVVGQIRVRG